VPVPELVVFDLDGVLVDTRHIHFQALDRALETCGHRPLTREQHADLDGLPTATKLRTLGLDNPYISRWKRVYTDQLIASLPPDPTKRELVEVFTASGWRVAVASNAVRSTVDQCLAHLNIAPEFSLSNEDVFHPKPDPEMYLAACSIAGLPPERVVVVEDRDRGVQAALAAGCWVLQVADPDEVTREYCDPDGWPWPKIRGGGVHHPETVHPHQRQTDDRPRPVLPA
jgi:HAD superfamily hydrolase (TIGR01509 family)